MDRKEDPCDLRDPSRAPEVAPSYSPIPAYHESEGLQVGYDYTGGKEAVVSDRSLGEKAPHYGEPAISPQPRRWYRRKRWLIAAVLLLVVIIAAAVGGGIAASGSGGDKAAGDTTDGGRSNSESPTTSSGRPQSTTPTTVTATAGTSQSASSTASSAAVAPATSGVASFSCENGTYMYSAQPAGLAYIEHCNTMYPYNSRSRFSSPDGLIEGLFSSTKYTFQSCVDSCDEWNDDNADAEAPCLSVSYYANLTNVFTLHESWGGNCILKSGVGTVTTNATDDSTMDWPLTASAYRACLQQGTPC